MRFLKHLRKRTAVVTLALALVITLFATQNAHAAGIVISTQPKAASVPVGGTARFTVAATGSGALTYQWQAYSPSTKKWVNSSSPSAKTASLTLTAQAGHNGFQFRCLVKDSKGNEKYSDAAKLTVTSAITVQPQPTTVGVGSIAKFTVAAAGPGPFTYQWQAKSPTGNWVNSSAAGAKKATVGITTSAAHNGFKFRCIVTDGTGKTLTSKEATLTVVPVITVQPKPVTVTVGGTAKFTITANGKATLTYQWQAKSPSGNWVNSSAPSAKKAVFSFGAQVGHDGYQFRCIVTDGNGKQVTSTPVTLTVNPGITTQPQPAEVNAGEVAHFSIVAEGRGTLSYRWQVKAPGGSWKDASASSAKTANFNLTTIADHDGFSVHCIVTDGVGKTTTSNAVALTVKPVITTQPASATKAIGESVSFTVAANGKNLTYQWQVLAPNGTWQSSTGTGATSATLSVGSMTAALNGYKYRCIVKDSKQRTLTSNAATLKAKTTITTQPSSKTIDAGGTATFTIAATGAGLTYKWQYSTNQSDWTNASGATGTSFSYTPSGTATSYVRCVITDANGATVTSNVATVTINYSTDILINETNFPDATFRNYIQTNKKINRVQDNKLTQDEISRVTKIQVNDMGITSLKGIEYFTALTSLECANNALTSLDVSKLTALAGLACSGNQIRTLDVSKNTQLEGLSCENNYLSSLNLSKNAKLYSLTCSYNGLTSLNLSANPLMRELDCSYNLLTTLQLPTNNVIYTLNCKQNHLSSIDLTGASEINTINISNTDIASIDINPFLSSFGNLTVDWHTEVIGKENLKPGQVVSYVDIEEQWSITIPLP